MSQHTLKYKIKQNQVLRLCVGTSNALGVQWSRQEMNISLLEKVSRKKRDLK